MHRDIKPDNIIFFERGNINSLKIVDFGLAINHKIYPYLYPKYEWSFIVKMWNSWIYRPRNTKSFQQIRGIIWAQMWYFQLWSYFIYFAYRGKTIQIECIIWKKFRLKRNLLHSTKRIRLIGKRYRIVTYSQRIWFRRCFIVTHF